jgi:hypothetical protein
MGRKRMKPLQISAGTAVRLAEKIRFASADASTYTYSKVDGIRKRK